MVPKVATIQDLSGLGRGSLTASLPVLSALGVQACPIPTAVLSCQTGFSPYHMTDGSHWLDAFLDDWQQAGVELNGICTGFLANEQQAAFIWRLIERFRRSDTLLLVDPVMGDDGAAYVNFTPRMGEELRRLAYTADVITPNLTEACLLTDTDYAALVAHESEADYPQLVADIGKRLVAGGIPMVAITGVRWQKPLPRICNITVSGERCTVFETPPMGGHFSGTGDLFAAVTGGALVRGLSLETAAETATRFLEQAVAATDGDGRHGVCFEPFLSMLTNL